MQCAQMQYRYPPPLEVKLCELICKNTLGPAAALWSRVCVACHR